jgi:pimeloyl-ACP methyl ester carboxylesterase
MGDRRDFLGFGAAAVAATAAASDMGSGADATPRPRAGGSLYPGIMGRGYARGPYGLVHFHDSAGLVKAGSGSPLILLHQSPSSARQFEAAFRPLVARGIRFIAIDTPGFGFSDPPPEMPKLEHLAPPVVAVMDHLGIPQADVLGHHTGALVASEVALQSPSRVRRLILNGAFPISEEQRAKILEGQERGIERGKPALDGSHFQYSFDLRKRMYGPNPDAGVLTRIVVEKYQGLAPFWWGHGAAYRYDHAASLLRITHRTLLLTNTGDDIYDLTKRAAAMRPDFEYRELEGGTHDIVDQQPQAWCDAVVEFLRSPDRAHQS